MRGGVTWEFTLQLWHRQYRDQRKALIFKSHPPIRMLGKPAQGRFLACFESTGPPDFIGFVGDRGVVFDAKEVSNGARFALNRIEPHQAADLEAALVQGHIAFLAVRFVQKGKMVVFPWSVIRDLYYAKVSSVKMSEGLEFREEGWIEVLSRFA